MNRIGTSSLQYFSNPLGLLRSYALLQSRLGAIDQSDDGKILAVESFYFLNYINENFGSAFQATDTISVLTFVPGAR